MNEVIFCQEDTIRVLISGSATLMSHANSLTSPLLLANLAPGTILGYDSIDLGNSNHFNHWVICKSPTATTLNFHKSYFDFIWQQ